MAALAWGGIHVTQAAAEVNAVRRLWFDFEADEASSQADMTRPRKRKR